MPTKKDNQIGNFDAISSNQCELSFIFEDLIEKPIPNLKVKIVSAIGDIHDVITDSFGQISDYVMDNVSELKIMVSSATGKTKEVARFTPTTGKTEVRLLSPKVRVKGKSIALKGAPGTIDSDKRELNTVALGRDAHGNPRLDIYHLCPNDYDLLLAKNVIYWDAIIAASKRSGLIPQAIAAVIDAESAKKNGVWQPTSVAIDFKKTKAMATNEKGGKLSANETYYRSSAAGMTQFLNGTWIGETLKDGTYLNEKAKAANVVAKRPMISRTGREVKKQDGTSVMEEKFQVTLNVWKSLKELKKEHYITGVTPYPLGASGSKSLKDWLKLRFKPEYAIMAAVDYAITNLKALKAKGFNIDGLNDAEKAKVMYLTHHLGLSDAIKFIRKEITESKAKDLLVAQVGAEKAFKYYQDEHKSYVKGHRAWLSNFINDNIKLVHFYCHELRGIKIQDVLLSTVIKKL
ncbi:peptidoglycan-binding protein [Acerihabitans sp. KWT182]|uniref:Peptidoglycan-binding protein n=1 Tax=Acerihabitans sp. KWT182 TaxID=3157919 RepID=A0AAU7QA59_9GAMM